MDTIFDFLFINDYSAVDFKTIIKPFLQPRKSLPFSNGQFYLFIAAIIFIVFTLKKIVRTTSPKIYLYTLFSISFLYILFLYTKPIHIACFIIYGFILFKWISVRLKWRGITPIIIYILPLIGMKLFHILPEFNTKLSSVFQIAGLSYASFKMVQIHIDEYENKNINFIQYFTFLAFPPTLLIGPIDRFQRFTKNISQGFLTVNTANFTLGMDYFIRGLLYKYIFATLIHQLVITHLDTLTGFSHHLIYMYAYLFYLFFDFAGYSLLAIGFGYMIGIQVPLNFNKPFLAENPKEFWYRWHKSLGDWLNDYFFKPIFKELTTKKKFNSIQRQSIALFLTFTLMGFWNGFEFHYILSGVLFGIYSVVYNYYNYLCKKNGRDVIFGTMNLKIVKYISIFIMIHLVAFSIYIFSGELI